MKSLKIVKKILKQKKIWKLYKQKFRHDQMRFLTSKILLIFNDTISPKILVENEILLLKSIKDEKMFVSVFETFNNLAKNNYNWQAFGLFIWYVYQTSTFYYDQKHKIKNVYDEFNYLQRNNQKRQFYYQWLESIDPGTKNYNYLIKKVLKQVF